VKFVAFEEIVA